MRLTTSPLDRVEEPDGVVDPDPVPTFTVSEYVVGLGGGGVDPPDDGRSTITAEVQSTLPLSVPLTTVVVAPAGRCIVASPDEVQIQHVTWVVGDPDVVADRRGP